VTIVEVKVTGQIIGSTGNYRIKWSNGRTYTQQAPTPAPTPATTPAPTLACIDISGNYVSVGHTYVTKLDQNGCSGKCYAGGSTPAWSYTVSGSTVTIVEVKVTGQIIGSTGNYRIKWSNGRTYTQQAPTPAPTPAPTLAPTAVDTVPVPIESCTASSEYDDQYECKNAYDGEFGKPRADAGNSWASKNEGVDSWIKLNIDEPRKIDTMLYTNRRSWGAEENKDLTLTFSKPGKPAQVTLKKTDLQDHTFYSYCIPEVTTSFVKVYVKSIYGKKADNGAEEIAFVYTQGECPEMAKEKGGYYRPEQKGGNIPGGEIAPTSKAKCVAKCAANPACKAWNYKPTDKQCNLKRSTAPGFKKDLAWVAGEKVEALTPAPTPVPASCSISFLVVDTIVRIEKSTYHLNDLLTDLSDEYHKLGDLKKLDVTGDCTVTLFSELNFKGKSKTYNAGSYDDVANKWKSLKINE